MVQGQILEGRYRIIKILGQGGMSTVYLAENMNLGTLWAIKEIRKNSSLAAEALVEPEILKRLNHAALPRIFDVINQEENIYIIVDYIKGETLEKKLALLGMIPEEQVVDYATQICEVLSYLHNFKPNPIIYRDIKPGNIMITPEHQVKLIDFGIAREYKTQSCSDTVYIGTRGYAAPEQYGLCQTNAASVES